MKLSLARARRRPGQFGFTLIEMLIVISIMLILVSVAVPMYQRSIRSAREAVLKDNLFQLRSLIQQYTMDKQKAPQGLDDLVTAGYLKFIPNDITGTNETWVVDQEDVLMSIDQTQPGIIDVHSGSNQAALDGTPYSSW